MEASELAPAGRLATGFLAVIEAWCARTGMSAGAFGAASLRRGRSPRLRTLDRALALMDEPPAGPAFLREVEAFPTVTGIKRSLLGRGAIRPSLRSCARTCRPPW